MSDERETINVDLDWEGRRCIVKQLGAKPARAVARRLLNTAGPGIRGAGHVGGVASVEAVTAVAIGAILERLDDETNDWLTDTFAKVTSIESAAGSDTWLKPHEVSELAFG